MASNFDRNKYIDSFEKRFGSGAYESGLSNAREIGKAKVEAQLAKAEYDKRMKELEKQQKEAEKKSEIDKLVESKKASASKGKKNNYFGDLFSDIGSAAKRAFQSANPFDGESFGNALVRNATEFDKEKSDAFAGTERFSKRATNSTTLGLMENFDKKARGGEIPDYMQPREFGEGGGTDLLSDLLGYATPGVGIANVLRGSKLGAKGVGDLLKAPITKSSAKSIAKETAKEGAAVGAIMAGGEIAGRELLNPDDYNWKQNLAQLGIEATAGAVLDPALTLGVGKLISKIKKPPTGSGTTKFEPIPETSIEPDLPFSISRPPEPNARSLEPNVRPIELNTRPLEPNAGVIPPKKVTPVETPKTSMNDTESAFVDISEFDPTFAARQENVLKELDERIVKGLGIKHGSKLSQYVQDLGENRLSLEELKKLAPNDWHRVVEAEKWFKENEDKLLYAMEFMNKQGSSLPAQKAPNPATSQRSELDTLMDAYNGKDVPLKRMTSSKASTAVKQADSAIKVDPGRKLELDKEALPKPPEYTEGVDPTLIKDISGFKGATNDVYRIFDRVFGENSNVTKRVLGELDSSKARHVDMQQRYLKELDEKIVKGLGIKKGSKLSKYVQDYGEGNMPLGALQEQAPNDWEKVVDADKWFRSKYDELIDEVNASRSRVYPNDPSKIVPKREDYYRHYNELTSLTGLKNIFDSPSAIDPHLAGTSDFTKPGSRYAGFMQRRGIGRYKSDAVGGFLNYLPAASYATNIDPNVKTMRALRSELADRTADTKNLNHFIEYLNDYANDLAGKTNPVLDRFVQKYIPGGRKSMATLTWLNNRVKTNTILGNLGSTLAQVANIPNGIAFAKQHSVKGVGRSMRAISDKTEPIHKSPFIKERFSNSMYRDFDQRWIDQPQKAAEWLMETSDRIGTSFIWNASYEKGLKQGVANPIKYADNHTRRLVAGRGVGEVPLAQKSKVVQMIMPFTLEVGNLWRVMNDMRRTKDFGGLAILFTANYLFNNVMEEVRGSGVVFDPIEAMLDVSDQDIPLLQKGGRLAGEALSNVPFGQFLAGIYPEYGEIAGFQGPTRKELFGDRNPQRFGTGLLAADGLADAPFKVLPPFGGNQLKKTLQGLGVIQNEGSYKKGSEELRFPVENSGEDILKSLLFGPYSTDSAREYFDNNRKPLSEKQTAEYHEAKERGVGSEFYDLIIGERNENNIRRRLKEIQEDETLSDKERKKKIQATLDLLELK